MVRRREWRPAPVPCWGNEPRPRTRRMTRVSGPGLPAWGAVYSYWPRSNLVRDIKYKSSQTESAVGSVFRNLELNRDALTAVTNKWPATSSAVRAYTESDSRW